MLRLFSLNFDETHSTRITVAKGFCDVEESAKIDVGCRALEERGRWMKAAQGRSTPCASRLRRRVPRTRERLLVGAMSKREMSLLTSSATSFERTCAALQPQEDFAAMEEAGEEDYEGECHYADPGFAPGAEVPFYWAAGDSVGEVFEGEPGCG